MIGVINTERCNLASVLLAIEKLNFESRVVHEPAEILSCSKLIMSGVGATVTVYLQSTGLSDAIIKAADKKFVKFQFLVSALACKFYFHKVKKRQRDRPLFARWSCSSFAIRYYRAHSSYRLGVGNPR